MWVLRNYKLWIMNPRLNQGTICFFKMAGMSDGKTIHFIGQKPCHEIYETLDNILLGSYLQRNPLATSEINQS